MSNATNEKKFFHMELIEMVNETLIATKEIKFFDAGFIKQMKYRLENGLTLNEKQRRAIEKVYYTFAHKKEC